MKKTEEMKLFILAYYGSAPALWKQQHARNLLPHRKSSTRTIALFPADVAITYSYILRAWKEAYWCLGMYRYVWDAFCGTSLVAIQIPSFIWWYKFRWPITMGLSFPSPPPFFQVCFLRRQKLRLNDGMNGQFAEIAIGVRQLNYCCISTTCCWCCWFPYIIICRMRVGYLKVYVHLCRNDAGFFTWQCLPLPLLWQLRTRESSVILRSMTLLWIT